MEVYIYMQSLALDFDSGEEDEASSSIIIEGHALKTYPQAKAKECRTNPREI